METSEKIGLILLTGGAGLMMIGVARLFWLSRRETKNSHTVRLTEIIRQPPALSIKDRIDGKLIVLTFILVFAAAAFIRFDGLADKSLSHPEIYVPGIELPANISEPPPRTSLVPLLWFHFHGEPHPPAYYFLMFGWTKLFGTTVFALRLPSVIFGLLSVFLIFRIGCKLFNDRIGLIAAILLAFNGHQIYWSQTARMYAMTCFLGLLATFSLVKILQDEPRTRAKWGAVYLLAVCLGVYTEILFWALLAGQTLYVICQQIAAESNENRQDESAGYLLGLQSIAVICGAPMWAHAVYTGRNSPLEYPSANFFGEFLAFGFIFERDSFSFPARSIPDYCFALLVALGIICLAMAFFRFGASLKNFQTSRRILQRKYFETLQQPPKGRTGLIAIASIIAILGFNLLAAGRHERILLTCLVVAGGYYLVPTGSLLKRSLKKLKIKNSVFEAFGDARFLLIMLSFLPLFFVAFVSLFNSLLASRLFLLFTPYLLLLYACGIWNLISRSKMFGALLIPVLVAICALSVSYYRIYPSDVIDYRNLAEQINDSAQNGDTVLVHKRRWVTTPIFYYLDFHKLLITAENSARIENDQTIKRVWTVNFEGQSPTPEMIDATKEFHKSAEILSRRCNAVLFER